MLCNDMMMVKSTCLFSAVVKNPPNNLWIIAAVLAPIAVVTLIIIIITAVLCRKNKNDFKADAIGNLNPRAKVSVFLSAVCICLCWNTRFNTFSFSSTFRWHIGEMWVIITRYLPFFFTHLCFHLQGSTRPKVGFKWDSVQTLLMIYFNKSCCADDN